MSLRDDIVQIIDDAAQNGESVYADELGYMLKVPQASVLMVIDTLRLEGTIIDVGVVPGNEYELTEREDTP